MSLGRNDQERGESCLPPTFSNTMKKKDASCDSHQAARAYFLPSSQFQNTKQHRGF